MRLGSPPFWIYALLSVSLLNDRPGALVLAAPPEGEPLEEAPASGARTVEKIPSIAGCRIEPISLADDSFHGYTIKGASIVAPSTTVQVVIFGYWLDELSSISFIPSALSVANCSQRAEELTFSHTDFVIQTDKRMMVSVSFPPTDPGSAYHLCMQSRSKFGVPNEFHEISDTRTWITTELPDRVYYFPFPIQVVVIAALLVLSGLFSGLNLGLMSLTPQELMLIQKSGSKSERRYAEIILPVRERGNLLLCSLLIGNVLVNSGISILLDDLTSGYVALIGASAGIVVFGEIFPQSLCVKKGLAVGAHTIWVTRFFIVLTFPVAYPISKILDVILGEEVTSYDRRRLMELIKMSNNDGLQEELKIAVGAMEISDKTVLDVMTKIDDVFMLPYTTVLNTKTVAEILRMGYTRIPVFSGDRNSVVSLLFVKDLALLDPDDNFTIQTVCGYHQHPLRFVMEDTPLRVMLEEFKKGDYHLAMVQRIAIKEDADPHYELVGVVTLEDIVEEILQAEIVDETDAVMDNVHRTRRRGAQARDISSLVEAEEPSRVISVQMLLVTMQWLTSNHRAFHQDMISQTVLERLIRQHCRKVELSHLPDMYDSKTVIPRTAKLYTKQDYTDKFILILEGRAMVTIGQDAMTFEAGPWHAFGTEMLERLVEQSELDSSKDKENISSRSSLNAAGDISKTGKVGFIPDFSVVVRDECTFLEVTAQSWMLAYRSTLMSRGGHRPSMLVNDTHLGERTLSRGSLNEAKATLISPKVNTNYRNCKNRSCSESEHLELLPQANGAQLSGSPLSDRSVISQM